MAMTEGEAVLFKGLSPTDPAHSSSPSEPGSTFSLETLARGSVDIGRVSAVASVSTKEGLRIVCLCGHQVVLLTFPLNHDATAVCWNPAGTCVVVGDARGSLHFVTCDGALLFSQQIFQVAAGSDGDGTPPRVFGGMAFAASAPDAAASDVDELVVASVDGQVLRFGNLRVQALRDAAVSRDPAVVRSARRSITLSKLSVTDLFADGVNDVAVTRGASGTVVAIAGDGDTAAAVFVATTATSDDGGGATPAALALEAAVARDMVGCGVAQLALSADGSNLFLVGADGTLSWWRLPGVVLVAAWAVRGVCRVAIVPAADTTNGGNGAAPGAGHSGSSGAGGGGAGASIATSLGLDAAAPSAVLVAALVSGHGDGDHEQLWLVEADLDAGAFSEGAATVSVRLPRGSWLSAPVSAGVPHDTASRDTLGPDLSTAGETGVVVCAAGGGVDEVMLWHLSRAVPLARVEALVGSGQFDAALAWAASHGIDHAEVFAAQAAVLSRRLTAASTATVDGGDDAAASSDADAEAAVDEFITSMDEVADLRRVTRWCLDTVVRQRSLTSRLMEYAERRVINRMEVLGIDEDDNEDDGSAPADTPEGRQAATLHACFGAIQEARRRWTSFGLLSPFAGGFDCLAWHAFRSVSLGGELQRLIGAGHVRVAIALWRRHASPSLAAVAADAITAIPVTTPVRSFVPWLRDEVVPLLDVAQRRRLSSWLARRAVEVEARTGSPHHALLLATVLGGATAGVLYDLAGRGGDRSIAAACYRSDFVRRLPTPAQAVHRAITGRAAFAPLVAAHVANRRAASGVSSGGGDGDGDGGLAAGMDSPLARVCALLSSLVYLHDVHGLALNLDQIKRDTAAGIGVALLDREDNPAALGGVDVDDHVSGGGAIDVHVRPWCRRHGVDCDALLFTYVAELCTAIVGSDEVLESRCLAVLLCIQDSAVRVDAAMALLQAVSPPYSSQLQWLVSRAVTWSSPRAAEVREQRRLMALHGVLRRYGVKYFAFDNRGQASMLLAHVTAQIHHPQALADAFLLTRAYPHLHAHDAHTAFLHNIATAPLCHEEVADARRKLASSQPDAAGDAAGDAEPSTQAVLVAVLAARAARIASSDCLCEDRLAPADVLLAGQEVIMALVDVVAECGDTIGAGRDAARSGELAGTDLLQPSRPAGHGSTARGTHRVGFGIALPAAAGESGTSPHTAVALGEIDAARWLAASATACAEAVLARLLALLQRVDRTAAAQAGTSGGGSDSSVVGVVALNTGDAASSDTAGAGVDGDHVLLTHVTPQLQQQLRTAATLQREFGLFLSLDALASREVCMALLQRAVAPVVSGASTTPFVSDHLTHATRRGVGVGGAGAGAGAGAGGANGDGDGGSGGDGGTATNTLLSRAFRLAELMAVPREDLRALLARECARAGDVLASLRWCRDLSRRAASQAPDASTAATATTLRDVALTLSAYTVQHPAVFNVRPHTATPDAKARAHAPAYARALLQQAVAIASEADLAHTLSLWSGADMVTQVLAKSEVGEYGRLWEAQESGAATTTAFFGADALGVLSGRSAERLGRGKRVPATASSPSAAAAAGGVDGGGRSGAVEDRFAEDIHVDWFKETCMVLKTSRAMAMVSRYAVAEQACRQSMDGMSLVAPTAHSGTSLSHTDTSALGLSRFSHSGVTGVSPPPVPPHSTGGEPSRRSASAALSQLVQYLAGHNAVQLAVHTLLSAETLTDEQVGRLEDLVGALSLKVLRSRDVDTGMALGCMLTAPTPAAFQTFKSVLPSVMDDYPRLLRVACVGMDAATAWHQMQFLAECRSLHSNARWWMLMHKLGLPVDTKLFTGMGGVAGGGDAADEYRRSMLPLLLENTSFHLPTALQYCATFGIEEQAAVLMFIEYLLIHPAARSQRNYKALILDTASKAPTGPLAEILHNAYAQASPIDYDRLHFICTFLARVGSREDKDSMARHAAALAVLRTFSSTPLTSPPTDNAAGASAAAGAGMGSADSTAAAAGDVPSWLRCRDVDGAGSKGEAGTGDDGGDGESASLQDTPLPFHDLVADPWSVLRPYITAANLPRLVALAASLGLDPDHFYVHIVTQIVQRHAASEQQASQAGATGLRLRGSDQEVLTRVEEHLRRIRDHQLRIDTAQWCADHAPDGVLKVKAYDLVARLATAWHEELLPTDAGFRLAPIAAEAAQRAQELRDRHQTALDIRALGGDDMDVGALLGFLDNPRELVCQIFHLHAADAARQLHQRHGGLGVTTRDGMEVHRVASTVAARHGVDMLKVKRLLIQHWVFEDLSAAVARRVAARATSSTPTPATAAGAGKDGRGSGGGGGSGTGTGGGGDGGDGAGDGGGGGGGGDAAAASVFDPSVYELAQEAEVEAELKIVYVLLPTSSTTDATANATATGGGGAASDAAAGHQALMLSGAKALLNVATMRQSSKRSYRSRARAVSAVFRLLDTAAIDSIHAPGAAALESYWRYCLYMAEFEEMRIPQEMAALQACSKPALARGLWRDHRHNPRAVRLIAQLLVDFSINDANLWLAVLRQLRLFGQHRQLLALLEPLSALDCVRGSKEMGTLWEQVLLQPFRELSAARERGHDLLACLSATTSTNNTTTDAAASVDKASKRGAASESAANRGGVSEAATQVLAVLEQVMVMLQRCPVLQLVDVQKFVTAFWNLGPAFHSHAVRCAFTLPLPVARVAALRRIMAEGNGVYLAVLDEVSDSVAAAAMQEDGEGQQGVLDDVSLVRSVFDAIDGAGAHAQLQGTPYLEQLALYLVTRGRVTGLLATILENRRFDEALALVGHYHMVHPDSASALAAAAAPPGASKWLPLELYARHAGLPMSLLPPELLATEGTVDTAGASSLGGGGDGSESDGAGDEDDNGSRSSAAASDEAAATSTGLMVYEDE